MGHHHYQPNIPNMLHIGPKALTAMANEASNRMLYFGGCPVWDSGTLNSQKVASKWQLDSVIFGPAMENWITQGTVNDLYKLLEKSNKEAMKTYPTRVD